jgi:DNA-binding winged helix-turn-helix (wHTH) protein
MATCPRCHQPIRHERFGIYLPPRKARIMDVIAAAGDIGIGVEELIYAVWGDVPRTPQTLKSHICQLNDALENSGVSIRCERNGRGRGLYYLAREKAAA